MDKSYLESNTVVLPESHFFPFMFMDLATTSCITGGVVYVGREIDKKLNDDFSRSASGYKLSLARYTPICLSTSAKGIITSSIADLLYED